MVRISGRIGWLVSLFLVFIGQASHSSEPQWVSVGPPGADWPMVVTTDPAWPDRVYVASDIQVFVSLDGGRHFSVTPGEVVTPYVYNSTLSDIAVLRRFGEPAPNSPPRILVATYQGLKLSTDGGASYAPSAVGDLSNVPPVRRIYPTPENDTVVYLIPTAEKSLYRSADGGATWQVVALPVHTYATDLAVISRDGNALVLATRDGIFKTASAGAGWLRLANGLPEAPYTALGESAEVRLASDPANPASLYLVLPNHGIYRSNDGGGSWLQVHAQAPGIGAVRSLIASGESIWLLTQQLDRSTDSGRTWRTLFPAAGRPASPYSIARDAQTGRLHLIANATGVSGLWRSDDEGDTWVRSASGLNAARVPYVLSDAAGAIFSLPSGYGGALLKTDDAGATWKDVSPPGCSLGLAESRSAPSVSAVVAHAGNQLLVDCAGAGYSHAYHASTDGGVTWGLTGTGSIGLLAVEPGVPGTLFGSGKIYGPPIPGTGFQPAYDVLHTSENGGRTWRSIHAGLPEFISAGALFVHTGGGGRLLVNSVWFSADSGASWQRNDLPAGNVWDVASTIRRPELIVVLVGNRLYRSEDAGRHFAPLGAIPPDAAPVTSFTSKLQIVLDPNADRTVYLVDPWGQVFVTADDAKTWSSLGAPLRSGATILDVTMSGTAVKSIYAGTDRASVVKFVAHAGFETATEFYHPAFDHYFVTAEPDEVDWLNLGNLPPWVPTGHTWTVWSLGTAGTLPVCRFFSTAFAPKSSHFYTPYPQECADLIREGAWQYEGDAFGLRLPFGLLGYRTCAFATRPLYRAYNDGQGGAPNHRYTIDPAILDAMVAQGWIMEGEAATRVFACVPAP